MKTLQSCLIAFSLLALGFVLGKQQSPHSKTEFKTEAELKQKKAHSKDTYNSHSATSRSKQKKKKKKNRRLRTQTLTPQDNLDFIKEQLSFKGFSRRNERYSDFTLIIDFVKNIPLTKLPKTLKFLEQSDDFEGKKTLTELMASRLGEEGGLRGFELLKDTLLSNNRTIAQDFFYSWAKESPDDIFSLFCLKEPHQSLMKHSYNLATLIMKEKIKNGLDYSFSELENLGLESVQKRFREELLRLAQNKQLHKELLVSSNIALTKIEEIRIWTSWMSNSSEALTWGQKHLNSSQKNIQRVYLKHGQVEAIDALLNNSDFQSKTESWDYIGKSFSRYGYDNYKIATAKALIERLEQDYDSLPKSDAFFRQVAHGVFIEGKNLNKEVKAFIKHPELKKRLKEFSAEIEIECF